MGLKTFLAIGLTALMATASATTKVACVGNSITEGYGLDWNDKKYPDHLQEFLGENFTVKNFGNSGKMFHKKSDESYWKQTTFTNAYEFAPDIVVIELGTNDSKYFHDGKGSSSGFNYYAYSTKGYTKESIIEEMKKDYEALIDTFAHQPQAPKIFATLQPYANSWDWFITDTAIVNQINPIIKEAAQNKGAELIDLHTLFDKKEWLLADSVHPNATGAQELARIVANAILKKTTDSSSSEAGSSIPKSSSSAEPESSSNTTALVNPVTIGTKIFAQGNAIIIDKFIGSISIFDLNGNLVHKAQALGNAHITVKHPGIYVVRIGQKMQAIKIRY